MSVFKGFCLKIRAYAHKALYLCVLNFITNMKNLNDMKFKREHFRVDYETSKKINLLCDCLNISKSKLFLMGIEEIYNQAILPDGAVKNVKKSIADALMSIAIYLNSEAKEEDLSQFYEEVKFFLEGIKSDSKLI